MSVIIIARIVYVVFTLYMLLVILRWIGPAIEFDLASSRFRILRQLVDPVLAQLRKVVPVIGPFDASPLALLLLVWVVRMLVVTTLLESMIPR